MLDVWLLDGKKVHMRRDTILQRWLSKKCVAKPQSRMQKDQKREEGWREEEEGKEEEEEEEGGGFVNCFGRDVERAIYR